MSGLSHLDELEAEAIYIIREVAAEVLGKKLRQTDYVGMLDGGLYVLLSDTEEKNALGVITRFAEAGYESTIANGEVAA